MNRPYLSWSSMDQFERSPETWVQVYVKDNRNREFDGQDYGRIFAEAIEKGVKTGDPLLDAAVEKAPKYEIRDKVLNDAKGVEVEYWDEQGNGKVFGRVPTLKIVNHPERIEIPLLVKPDSLKADLTELIEYKTGSEPWSCQRASKLGQIKFYAAAIHVVTGKVLKRARLVHIETVPEKNERVGGRFAATGNVFSFEVPITMTDILEMKVRMKKNWLAMGRRMEEELL